MNERRQELVVLLRAFADALAAMSDEEYASLLENGGKLRYVRGIKKQREKALATSTPELSIEEVAERFRHASTRDEARHVLDSNVPHGREREYLTLLAQVFGVHITKQDNARKIADKLIALGVGANIRSEAIQTLPLT